MGYPIAPKTLINNVFSFSDPEDIDGVIWNYAAGHSEMEIQLFDNNKGLTYHLDFTMVHYFSGPLKWKSANFQLHPWTESFPLMRELGQLPNLEDSSEEVLQMIVGMHYKLYTVSAVKPKIEIKILSTGGRLREIE